MNIYPYFSADYAHATLRINGERSIAECFFRSMKENSEKFKLRNLIYSEPTDGKNLGFHYISFDRKDIENSVFSTWHKYKVPFRVLVCNGNERWIVALSSQKIYAMTLKELIKKSTILTDRQFDYPVEPHLKFMFQSNESPSIAEIFRLSMRESEALSIAYSLGYFDLPRRAYLTDVSRELSISKAAVNKLIRKNLWKILNKLFDDYGLYNK